MFYHSFILGQRGPLAKIWLAAHYDKKLGKKEIISANIETCVDSIINSRLSLSLRTTSHLLLGVTKLLHKQANYLLKDLAHAAFFFDSKSKSVDLPKARIQARLKDITLPEMINFEDNFELIPDPPIMNEFKFKSYLDKNKLIEDLDSISFTDPLLSVLDCYSTHQPHGDHQLKISLEDLDKPITDDGFGGPYVSNIDQLFEDIPQDQGFEHVHELTQTEYESVASRDVDRLQRSRKVSFDVASDSTKMTQDVNRLKIDDLTRSVSSIEVGRGATSLTELKDQDDAILTRESIEIVRGPSMGRHSLTRFKHQRIILEPLNIQVIERVNKKTRSIAIDARLTLSKKQFLKRLHPYNDTIGVLNLAPSSRKMEQLGEQTSITNLMSQFMRYKMSFQLKQHFHHHFHTRRVSGVDSDEEETEEISSKQEQEKHTRSKVVIEMEPQEKVTPKPEIVAPTIIATDEPAMEISEAAEEMLLEHLEILEPKETIFSEIPKVSVVEDTKLYTTKLESSKKLIRDKPQEEEELSPPKRPRHSSIGEVRAASETSVSLLAPEFETFVGEESCLGESIQGDLYNSLIQAISTTSVVTFSSITQNNSRLEAVIKFYYLLLLHQQRKIKMEQSGAYQEIYIFTGSNYDQFI